MQKDYYQVLGLECHASAKEIASAYRSLALRYHPDKSAAPEALQRFHDITRAYQVLTDSEARRALDAFLAAQAANRQREAELSASRRELRDELLQREREARKRKAEEEASQQRLLREIERLKREAAAAAAAASAALQNEKSKKLSVFDDLDRTLKVTSKSKLDSDALSSILSPYGEVENILISKKALSAVVVLRDVLVAKSIMMDADHGELSSTLSFSWAKGHPPEINEDPDLLSTAELLDARDFESLTLMKMRQRAERAHLRAKLEKEEDTS